MAVLNSRIPIQKSETDIEQQSHTGTTIWDKRPPTGIHVTTIIEHYDDEEGAPLWVCIF